MMDYTYSIIIPHRNCPKLLERCINSIPDRNDLQIIVVDDNSTDVESLKRLEKTFNNKNVTFVYTKEGKGAGYARNEGLKIAKGKWLVFSDSDDYFLQEAFHFFDDYAEGKEDIVVFKHTGVDSETLEPLERSELRNIIIEEYLANRSLENENKLRYNNDVPWAKMIRQKVVSDNDIVFDEVPASNDIMFSTLCGYYAKKITADNRVPYVAVTRYGSISKTKSKERYLSSFIVNLRKNAFLKQIGHPENQGIMMTRWVQCLLNFGPVEAIKYIILSRQYNVSPFYGINSYFSISKIVKMAKVYFTKDKYMKK